MQISIYLALTRIILLLAPGSWNWWDAPHYIYLAQNWYTNVGDEANFIVFFPLYPLLLKPFFFLFNPVWAGIILSSFCFILGCLVFYKLVEHYFSAQIAKRAVFVLSIFPTSYFFNAPYTESLFLLVSASSFYFASKKNYLLSGAFAGLSTLTRPFGILILPTLLYHWFTNSKKPLNLALLAIPTVAALIIYLEINYEVYDNFFQFLTIQREHWHKSFNFPWSGLVSTWEIALSGPINNYTFNLRWVEALSLTFAWGILPFILWKTPKPWFIFSLLSVLLFSSTTFVLSTPRYLLSLFPIFVILAMLKNYLLFPISIIFIILLFTLTHIYTTGQWAF